VQRDEDFPGPHIVVGIGMNMPGGVHLPGIQLALGRLGGVKIEPIAFHRLRLCTEFFARGLHTGQKTLSVASTRRKFRLRFWRIAGCVVERGPASWARWLAAARAARKTIRAPGSSLIAAGAGRHIPDEHGHGR